MEFRGLVVVITGAARGIGRALAQAYSDVKATVVLLDKDQDDLEHTLEQTRPTSPASSSFVVDITKPADIASTFKEIENKYVHIDILINNAGLSINKPIDELEVEEWDYVINTNLRGAFLCTQHAQKLMTGSNSSIVNIASTRALMSEADTFAYSASKGGLLSLTHSLAVSLGPKDIRVNAISPGWIHTGDRNELSDADHKQHPVGRVGTPADIVKACFYLTDPENGFVTGSNLVIDGGMTTKMIYIE